MATVIAINPYEASTTRSPVRRANLLKLGTVAAIVLLAVATAFIAGYWVGLKDRHFGHDGSTFKRDWLPLP